MEAGEAGGSADDPSGSLALVVQPLPAIDGRAPGFVVPFPDGVGVAAFRRQNRALLVFDQPRPLDLHRLGADPWLRDTRLHVLPGGTLLMLPLPRGLSLRLQRVAQGWRVTSVPGAPPLQPLAQATAQGGLLLAARVPGKVVSLSDPETGTVLLVGTQREPGQAVAIRRIGPEFALLTSWQGLAVEALSDRLTLRPVPEGFRLAAEPGQLSLTPLDGDALAQAASLTRRFHFPTLPAAALRQRIEAALRQVATTPALARGKPQVALARDLLGLGLAPEAEGVLRVAMEDDPHEAALPDAAGLAAIAALLANRPGEAGAVDDSRLGGSDEVAFWRAVRLALTEDASPQAAAGFAVTGALVLAYPAAMRQRLLPLVLDTMLRGGQPAAAAALLARSGKQPGLQLAQAMSDEAEGKVDAALAAYDTLARSPDQQASARAAVQAVELRLRLARISPRHAADVLDRLLYAWRGDQHDLALRERLAALRQQNGQWREALSLLREAVHDFPAQQAELHDRLHATFAQLLHERAAERMSPLGFVSLVEENADLLPGSGEGQVFEAELADRLVALDLPGRAAPVLARLMQAAPTPAGRATFGARLAALRLREDDAAGALDALLASAAEQLPPPLLRQRRLLFATATARRGDTAKALAILGGMAGADVAAARAEILEQAHDWPGADQALADYVARAVPARGALDGAQQRALLRLATAAARAGDAATLQALNTRDSVRMGTGPLADMFRLLTAPPVRGVGDLQRARHEAGLAQALPTELKTLQAMPPD